jgi:sugar phosphate isomerase/epimerase
MLLALVDSFKSDFVKMSLDVGHAMIMHRTGGGPTPDQWVAAAGNRLGHIHLQDTDGLDDRHWPPGRGGVNFFALFEEIKKLETTPRLILELDKSEWLMEGANHLIQ